VGRMVNAKAVQNWTVEGQADQNEYSRSNNSVPVNRKKLNKTLKNNFFCFLSKNTYIYCSA
jgi:hypothetical protein